MSKIRVCLTFEGKAADAAKFYTSVFKNSSITSSDAVSTVFRLEGAEYIALNGPPATPSTGMSLFVTCASQEEVDNYWNLLSAGGEEMRCGWLQDKFGITWQIVPEQLQEYLGNKDRAIAEYALHAMLKMTKIVIKDLKK